MHSQPYRAVPNAAWPYRTPTGTPPGRQWFPPTCDRPEVSVIIRYHNEPHEWLDAAVGSVQAQSGVTVEVIVVDDASEPPCLHYQGHRLGLLRLPYNHGAGGALQAGLLHARGEFVRAHDADDILTPGSLAAQVDALRAHPEAVLCAGHMEVLGHPEVEWIQTTDLMHLTNQRPEQAVQKLLAYQHNLLAGPTCMWRRDPDPAPSPALPAGGEGGGGGWDLADFFTAEDGARWRLLLATAPDKRKALVWLPQPLVRYRIHEGSNSGAGTVGSTPRGRVLFRACEYRVGESRRLVQHDLLAAKAKRPRTVAILSGGLYAGGAQWALTQVAAAVDRRLVRPVLVCGADAPMATWAREHGIEVRVKPAEAELAPWFEATVRELKPDVIDTDWQAVLLTGPVCERAKLVCAHAQGTRLRGTGLDPGDWGFTRAERILAVSRDVIRANPHLADKAAVVWSPVDSAAFRRAHCWRDEMRDKLSLLDGCRTILWSGRLMAKEKRVGVLRAVVEQAPDEWRFVLCGSLWSGWAGEAKYREEWNAWVAAQPNVRWLDQVQPWEMPPLVAACDAYLSTSHSEGMSLALLEAMAGGLPCVVHQAGGVAEALDEGLTGFILRGDDPNDYLAALADATPDMGRLAARVAAGVFDVRRAARAHALTWCGVEPAVGFEEGWRW
ncbi:MAG: glycosyltransferase [Armatimonadetes bacterium]|nr:glycosyltransferase [Armatimonadota bacterium]